MNKIFGSPVVCSRLRFFVLFGGRQLLHFVTITIKEVNGKSHLTFKTTYIHLRVFL